MRGHSSPHLYRLFPLSAVQQYDLQRLVKVGPQPQGQLLLTVRGASVLLGLKEGREGGFSVILIRRRCVGPSPK